MKILVDLIQYAKGTHGYDWRYKTLVPMLKLLEGRGHKIFANVIAGVKNPPFQKWTGQDVDHYIVYVTYNDQKREDFRKSLFAEGKKATMYDHGWLPRSMVFDKQKRFGDSWYCERIAELAKNGCPDPSVAEPYRLELLEGNLSKRPQNRVDKIPDVDFVFVPGQVLHDSSVVFYSKTGMRELIKQTTEWAKDRKLHVVYKPHPGLLHFPNHGKKILAEFAAKMKREYKNFHVINTSIFDLMQKARFTACVNSGSVIDNLVTNTPCYCCGTSFFYKSGTMVYDPDVKRGLNIMYHKDYNWKEMKLQQNRVLWWLNNHMVQEKLTPEENVRRLSYHAGVKF